MACSGFLPSRRRSPTLSHDFQVFDDPHDLMRAIKARDTGTCSARVVAGYCWEWPAKSKRDPNSTDVVLPQYDFAKSWNVNDSGTWAIDPDTGDQIGCVHTTQGLEFDYVGVIVGDDMRFENGAVVTDPSKRARSDASLNGIKKLASSDPQRAQRIADEIIRNTYRVLMTRGMKGCYVFCTNPALSEYLRERIPCAGVPVRYESASRDLPLVAEDHQED